MENRITKYLTSAAGVVLLALILSMQAAAQRNDGPPTHNLNGTWSLRQGNGFVVTLTIKQNGGEITGSASYNAGRKGTIKGTVTGKAWQEKRAGGWQNYVDHFQIEIAWDGSVGVYNATISWADGMLSGSTYQKDKPSTKTSLSAGPFARRRG